MTISECHFNGDVKISFLVEFSLVFEHGQNILTMFVRGTEAIVCLISYHFQDIDTNV